MSTPVFPKIVPSQEGKGDSPIFLAPAPAWLLPAPSGAVQERMHFRLDVLPLAVPLDAPTLPRGLPPGSLETPRDEINLAALLVCLLAEAPGLSSLPGDAALDPAAALAWPEAPRPSLDPSLHPWPEPAEDWASEAARLGVIALSWPIPEAPHHAEWPEAGWDRDDSFVQLFQPGSATDTSWLMV